MVRTALVLTLSLALGACSAFGLGGEAEVALMVTLWPEKARSLDFTVEVGERTLARDDFRDIDGRQFDGGPVTVAARWTEVSCTVSDGAASTAGTLRLDLVDGWRYGVSCAVAPDDPIGYCFGCRGSEAFPLDPELGLPGDSLYLVWGGDPADSGIIY